MRANLPTQTHLLFLKQEESVLDSTSLPKAEELSVAESSERLSFFIIHIICYHYFYSRERKLHRKSRMPNGKKDP